MEQKNTAKVRLGLLIDIDLCIGCGACMIACAIENNVPAFNGEAPGRRGITPIRIYSIKRTLEDGQTERAFVPVPCQHCENDPPCVKVCPQSAVQIDPRTGVVGQIAQRCMGCRYCMAACPYHARYFNWMDPWWPKGSEMMLNPDVAPRTRGVVEKCNLCHGRLHVARELAASLGRNEVLPSEYVPACEEACPTGAIIHADLNNPESRISKKISKNKTFRLLEELGTSPKVFYSNSREWVAESCKTGQFKEKNTDDNARKQRGSQSA